jgi:hypothetical protein
MYYTGLRITDNDTLVVTVWNSVAGQTVTVTGRYTTPIGQVVPFSQTLAPSSDRLPNTTTVQLAEGLLQGVMVSVSAATQRGQTFVRIALGQGTPPSEHLVLAQDYVTLGAPLGWPGGRISSPTEGPGAVRVVVGTDPAPGNTITEVVPSNTRWVLLGARVVLVTNATSATRYPRLSIDNGSYEVFHTVESTGVAASLTVPIFFGRWVLSPRISGYRAVALSGWPIVLRSGWRIRIYADSLQAGDDFSAPAIWVEEWIDV